MLAGHGLVRYSFKYDNWDANPGTGIGGTVTAGASPNTESATPLVLATGSNLSQDVYWVELWCHTSSGTGDRQILLDIGVDPSDGTSYTWILSNLVVGNVGAVTTSGGGQRYTFPLFIKAGSRVAVRTQCSQASINMEVAATFYGQPDRPELVPKGTFTETIGTITNSNGVSFTPGTTTDGSWTSLGTTTNDMWWWQLAYSISNGTITAEYTYIELAYGDASNKHLILRVMHGGTTSETCSALAEQSLQSSCFVPGGSTIYVRGRCNNAPDTGYNAVAVGVGG